MKNPLHFLFLFIALILTGCSQAINLTEKSQTESETEVNYSVIYYIHADSDYLYHTTEGEPVKGNSEVLATAIDIGETARSGEVFIYYQRPEKKLIGLFPLKSSRFHYYKNGKLVKRLKYRHADKDEIFLTTEVQLMKQFRTRNRGSAHQNYFLYFGHEIPSVKGIVYHRTLPHIEVNAFSLAKGLQNFLLNDEDRYNLVVLSTCNNGTPSMAELLMPFSDAMLASAQNLHLSHFDTDSLNLLESKPEISPIQIARSMAQQTFNRMEATIYTTITFSLYNFDEVQSYIRSLSSITLANRVSGRKEQFQDNVDCAENTAFEPELYRRGVETWYKPAKFGRQTGQTSHSGWGCKPGIRN